MSETSRITPLRPFVTFRGELDAQRATQLFRSRSIAGRCLSMAILMLFVTALCAGFWWFLFRGGRHPMLDVVASAAIWLFGVWFGLRSLSSPYLGRGWQENNAPLCGPYELALFDAHLDLRTSALGHRIPYVTLRPRSSSMERTYVRVDLDLLGSRALLLPLEDCDPSLTALEIKAFLQSRIRAAQTDAFETPSIVSPDHPPLPFSLMRGNDAIDIAGAVRAAAAQEVSFAEDQKRFQPSRADRAMPWFMLVMGLLMLAFVIVGRVTNRPVPQGMAYLAVTVIGFAIMMLRLARRRQRKPRITADPSASLAEINGWLSPDGFSVATEHGTLAAFWSRCDAVDITPAQIVVRFWNGQFFLFGRHIFVSDADWNRCVERIHSARLDAGR
jgi:hypothetical protein